ncbi:hypothetical protein CYMTET_15328 [Cymbomonas tetramitiformis]|uniref:Uncharacterized protein n=1 Tax=Cymbomonas tetramitiformis TaxID=36881 RepID=A0AAE0GEK8_9CHLO|nr:hypothetical protein CYMTET_15328 [Cymbomonas tetramitiformis]
MVREEEGDIHKPFLNGMLNVLPEEEIGMHPITVMETVSTDTRHVALEDSLGKFFATEKDIYGDNVDVACMNADCALNVLYAVLRAVLHMVWSKYDELVRAEMTEHNKVVSFAIVAWCLFHCKKSTKEFIECELTSDDVAPFSKREWVKFMHAAEHKVRHAKSIGDGEKLMDILKETLSSKTVPMEGFICGDTCILDVQARMGEPDEYEIRWVGIEGAVSTVLASDMVEDEQGYDVFANPFYVPKLANRTDWWKKYIVLWLECVIGERVRRVNTACETVNEVLKHNSFEGDAAARRDDYAVKRKADFQGTLAVYDEQRLRAFNRREPRDTMAKDHGGRASEHVENADDGEEGVPCESWQKKNAKQVSLSDDVVVVAQHLELAFWEQKGKRKTQFTWKVACAEINLLIPDDDAHTATESKTRQFAKQRYHMGNRLHGALLSAYKEWATQNYTTVIDGDEDTPSPTHDTADQGGPHRNEGKPTPDGECTTLRQDESDVGKVLAFFENEVGDMLWYPVEVMAVESKGDKTNITIRYMDGCWSLDQLKRNTDTYMCDHDEMVYSFFEIGLPEYPVSELEEEEEDVPAGCTADAVVHEEMAEPMDAGNAPPGHEMAECEDRATLVLDGLDVRADCTADGVVHEEMVEPMDAGNASPEHEMVGCEVGATHVPDGLDVPADCVVDAVVHEEMAEPMDAWNVSPEHEMTGCEDRATLVPDGLDMPTECTADGVVHEETVEPMDAGNASIEYEMAGCEVGATHMPDGLDVPADCNADAVVHEEMAEPMDAGNASPEHEMAGCEVGATHVPDGLDVPVECTADAVVHEEVAEPIVDARDAWLVPPKRKRSQPVAHVRRGKRSRMASGHYAHMHKGKK